MADERLNRAFESFEALMRGMQRALDTQAHRPAVVVAASHRLSEAQQHLKDLSQEVQRFQTGQLDAERSVVADGRESLDMERTVLRADQAAFEDDKQTFRSAQADFAEEKARWLTEHQSLSRVVRDEVVPAIQASRDQMDGVASAVKAGGDQTIRVLGDVQDRILHVAERDAIKLRRHVVSLEDAQRAVEAGIATKVQGVHQAMANWQHGVKADAGVKAHALHEALAVAQQASAADFASTRQAMAAYAASGNLAAKGFQQALLADAAARSKALYRTLAANNGSVREAMSVFSAGGTLAIADAREAIVVAVGEKSMELHEALAAHADSKSLAMHRALAQGNASMRQELAQARAESTEQIQHAVDRLDLRADEIVAAVEDADCTQGIDAIESCLDAMEPLLADVAESLGAQDADFLPEVPMTISGRLQAVHAGVRAAQTRVQAVQAAVQALAGNGQDIGALRTMAESRLATVARRDAEIDALKQDLRRERAALASGNEALEELQRKLDAAEQADRARGQALATLEGQLQEARKRSRDDNEPLDGPVRPEKRRRMQPTAWESFAEGLCDLSLLFGDLEMVGEATFSAFASAIPTAGGRPEPSAHLTRFAQGPVRRDVWVCLGGLIEHGDGDGACRCVPEETDPAEWQCIRICKVADRSFKCKYQSVE